MQKERDALKVVLEAQRNCMDTSGPASAGIRMSVFIDNATKRADNGLRGVLVGHRRSSQRAVEGRDVMMRCSRSVGGSNAGG